MVSLVKNDEISRVTWMFGRRWLHYKNVMWITTHRETILSPSGEEIVLEQYGSVEEKSIHHRTNLWSYEWKTKMDSQIAYFFNNTEDYGIAREEALSFIKGSRAWE